jgi:beta-lactamase class A
MLTLTATRRSFLLSTFGSLVLACHRSNVAQAPTRPTGALPAVANIEKTVGGRVGVYAVDIASGRELAYRAEERFVMCSTFKWVLAAQVLSRAQRSELSLDERVAYAQSDLLEYAPATREHVADGSMTVEALAEAAVTISDNTAANLLLAKCGGPAGFTQFVRSLGDSVTRLDRTEPLLNSNEPGDPRDTTSPRAMAGLMQQILCGSVLSAPNRERLLGWLRSSPTGKNRLRAGLPPDWVVGDKTGSGSRGAVNDVAIAVPAGGAPILVAAYMSGGNASLQALEAAHADIGRLVAQELTQQRKGNG